jgi:hypothetical protein
MQPEDVLDHARDLIAERGRQYNHGSDLDQHYRDISTVASIIIGRHLGPRDIALVLLCAKLIRSKSDNKKFDNYVDGVNYLAFAGTFAINNIHEEPVG